MKDVEIEEWDYDYFITLREQTVRYVERLGQGVNLHLVNADNTCRFYQESVRRWPQIITDLDQESFDRVREFMRQLAEEFGSYEEKREFAD